MLSSDDLAFFAVVSSARSLTAAARALNITPSAVTQRLKGLEDRAGVRLMDRSSRHLGLTDDGAMVAAHGVVVADAICALAEDLQNRSNVVSGHLRVGAPHGFGRAHVAPIVAAFAGAHPRVTASLVLSDHPGAREADSCDVVVHIGPPGPSNAIVTTLAENLRILCASPDYLNHAEPIQSPSDLVRHRCVAVLENDEDVSLWQFRRRADEQATVRIKPVMSTSDGSVARDWVLAGLGIFIRSEWDIAEDLARGRLERVLPEWRAASADVVAILGARQGRSERCTSFLAMLRQSLAPPPWRRPLAL